MSKGQQEKKPGSLRLPIKHATDAEAALIETTPKEISVEDLIAQKVPEGTGDLSQEGHRIGEFEKQVYRVDCTIKTIEKKKDGDYYLVVEGKTGAQAVIEVPDPAQCEGSPIHDKIASARKDLEDRYHPSADKTVVNKHAVVEGVGFYGWKGKPGSGGQGNSPRLMPGTKVKLAG